jgi:hypothetical protein
MYQRDRILPHSINANGILDSRVAIFSPALLKMRMMSLDLPDSLTESAPINFQLFDMSGMYKGLLELRSHLLEVIEQDV